MFAGIAVRVKCALFFIGTFLRKSVCCNRGSLLGTSMFYSMMQQITIKFELVVKGIRGKFMFVFLIHNRHTIE